MRSVQKNGIKYIASKILKKIYFYCNEMYILLYYYMKNKFLAEKMGG